MEADEFREKLAKSLGLKQSYLKGPDIMASCPNPDHADRKPSFGYNVENHYFNCWGCGLKGRGLVSLFYKVKIKLPDWASDFKLKIKPSRKIHGMRKPKEEFEVSQDYVDMVTQNNPLAVKKLAERDVPKKIVEKFRIGYNPKKDILYFPCFSKDGRLLGWAERSDNYSHRYKVMPDGVTKGELLFGEEFIPVGKNNVYLVEGPVDALKMWSWGFKAVAVFGSELLEKQMEKLLDIANYVIHIPDNDNAGIKFRRSAAQKLMGRIRFSQVTLPAGLKDIGEKKCNYDKILKAIENRREVNRSRVNG